jgi:chloramphenicol-sensitive protein RarD
MDSLHGDKEARAGVFIGLLAYFMWGIFPVYFKWIASVAPLEVLGHRVVWAVPFGALIILARRQWPEVKNALVDRTMLAWLALAALCISINWLIYIWAVQNDRIFETSLGYYINPLMYVGVGVALLGERLRRLQVVAVVLASFGVLFLAVSGGVFPWVALSLAGLFTAYGVIRKKITIGAMPGLFIETSLLFPIAAIWMIWLIATQQASLTAGDGGAAKRVTLTTIGFMQFLAPTLQFFTGLYYGERLTTAHLVCFGSIWAAVLFFSIDAFRAGTKKKKEKGVEPI